MLRSWFMLWLWTVDKNTRLLVGRIIHICGNWMAILSVRLTQFTAVHRANYQCKLCFLQVESHQQQPLGNNRPVYKGVNIYPRGGGRWGLRLSVSRAWRGAGRGWRTWRRQSRGNNTSLVTPSGQDWLTEPHYVPPYCWWRTSRVITVARCSHHHGTGGSSGYFNIFHHHQLCHIPPTTSHHQPSATRRVSILSGGGNNRIFVV